MSNRTAKLRRNQLDRFFKERASVFSAKTPKSGWVREIRQALGMTMQDLALRLNVIKQRIERIEKDEVAGKVTLHTLEQTAEALNCELVYFFVPKGLGLQNHLESQAYSTARKIVGKTEHSMRIEKQETSREAQQELIESLAQELIHKGDKKIWRHLREGSKSS